MESNLATPADIARHNKKSGVFGSWASVNPDYRPVAQAEVVSKTASPIGVWKIAFAVLLGNIMTGIIGGLLYAAMR